MNGLMLHCGGQLAPREEVFKVPVPPATNTYVPLPYESLITRIEKQLTVEGIKVKDQQLALAKNGQRLFGLMELQFSQFPKHDWAYVLGLRNSYDRSFATECVVGSSVFVCDNLSFSGELKFARKHTKNLLKDFGYAITETFAQLPARFLEQNKKFEAYREFELADAEVHDLVIRLFDAGAINLLDIGNLLKEYREPRHPEFAQNGKTAWRFFNACTETLKGDLWRLPARTKLLHETLDAECQRLEEKANDNEKVEAIAIQS